MGWIWASLRKGYKQGGFLGRHSAPRAWMGVSASRLQEVGTPCCVRQRPPQYHGAPRAALQGSAFPEGLQEGGQGHKLPPSLVSVAQATPLVPDKPLPHGPGTTSHGSSLAVARRSHDTGPLPVERKTLHVLLHRTRVFRGESPPLKCGVPGPCLFPLLWPC